VLEAYRKGNGAIFRTIPGILDGVGDVLATSLQIESELWVSSPEETDEPFLCEIGLFEVGVNLQYLVGEGVFAVLTDGVWEV